MKIKALAVFTALLAAPAAVLAGEPESTAVSAGDMLNRAEKTRTELPEQERTPLPAAPDKAGNAYAGLSAAFDSGTVPAKEDLLAWNAGRIFSKDYPEYPDGLLLAGWYAQPGAAGLKLVALRAGGLPSFYENLDPSLIPGLKVILDDVQTSWTAPEFGAGGVRFEKTLPAYDKGYSRFEVRKAADKRLILKNVWKTDMGGSVTSGTDYAVLTRNVTPK